MANTVSIINSGNVVSHRKAKNQNIKSLQKPPRPWNAQIFVFCFVHINCQVKILTLCQKIISAVCCFKEEIIASLTLTCDKKVTLALIFIFPVKLGMLIWTRLPVLPGKGQFPCVSDIDSSHIEHVQRKETVAFN